MVPADQQDSVKQALVVSGCVWSQVEQPAERVTDCDMLRGSGDFGGGFRMKWTYRRTPCLCSLQIAAGN